MEKNSGESETKLNLKCHICGKTFKIKQYLEQHMQVHKKKHECKHCGALFSFAHNLKRHERNIHGTQNVTKTTLHNCSESTKSLKNTNDLFSHNCTLNRDDNRCTFSCRHCHDEFANYQELIKHIERYHPLNQEGGRQKRKSRTLYNDDDDDRKTSNDRQEPNDFHTQPQTIVAPHPNEVESALRNTVENRYIYPRRNERYDMLTFFPILGLRS